MIGDFSVVSDNDKFLAKFHSGTLKIIGTLRLMSRFELLLDRLLEFVLTSIYGPDLQRSHQEQLSIPKIESLPNLGCLKTRSDLEYIILAFNTDTPTLPKT